MSNPMDANIPVLTDIIGPQDKPVVNELVAAPAAVPAPVAPTAPVAPIATPTPQPPIATRMPDAPGVSDAPDASLAANPAAAPVISEEEWQRLEQSIREGVLKQVLARVDFVLEHRVRDSLADVLQTAVEHLATDIRAGLHKTMEEVVTRAVMQEISKAKMSK